MRHWSVRVSQIGLPAAFLYCGWPLVAAGASAPDPQAGAQGREPKYEFGAALRMRAETRQGAGENPARQDGFMTSRLRLDLTLRPTKTVKVFLQAQDARVGGLAAGRNPLGARNPLDLRQGYVALGREDGAWTVYAGRRELAFLDRRLLGTRNWSNVSPTWDGAMLTVRRGAARVHLLGYSRVDIREGLDETSRTHFVYGVIGSIESWAVGQTIEPFLLTTRKPIQPESNLGGLLRTIGSRFAGTFSQTWDYQVILAAQQGGGRDYRQRAWMGVWSVGKTIEQVPTRPRLGIEWSYASGDRDPLDGRSGTFDTLFPARHRIYGEQDVTSLRNLKSLKSGVELRPSASLRLNLDFYDFRLASPQDGLYQLNSRRRITPPPGGAASDSVGSELDLVVRYTPVSRIEFRIGVSRFLAGEFVTQNLSQGGSQTFVYTALELRL